MRKKTIFYLSIIFFLVSCEKEDSSSVDQDRIYVNYVLEYNGNQDVTYARANFHFGNALGTKLELTDPAQVSSNGTVMPFRPALAMYESDFVGVEDEVTFQYVDLDENTFNNTIKMVDSIAIPQDLDSLSRSQSFELFWEGEQVKEGELVTVTIIGSNLGDGQIFTQAAEGANSVILTQNKLQNLGLENAQFYIRRTKRADAEEVTDAGGEIVSRFDASSKTVYILP